MTLEGEWWNELDFVHLDGRVLTLIHEKASETSTVNRGLSVTSFEVLISQALKGLRNLHSVHLHDGLLRGIKKKVAVATWHNGAPAKREQFLAELKALGSNYQRRLVIVQPQLTTVNLEKARISANPHEI